MIRVVHDLLMEAAAERPDKVAVFYKADTMTYGQIAGAVKRLDACLRGLGVDRADRVGFFLEKGFEKVISIFAIAMSGGVFVPIRKLSQGHQIAHIIADCATKLLITTYSRLPTIAEHLKDMPSLKTVIAIGPKEDVALPGVKIVDWEDALSGSYKPAPPRYRVVETDLAAILYTSGSTGKPKGVVLNHLNIVAGAYTVSEFLKINENDRLLSILTFGFDYGLNQLTTAFLHKAQIVLLEYLFLKEILVAAKKYEVTGMATVATTWIQLVPIWNEELPKLRYVTNSGGAIPETIVRQMRQKMPKTDIYLMYGLTEAFRSTFLDPSLVDAHPTSMGKAIPGEEILILDENHKPVPPGGTGELVHRGVLVAQGYWNAPDLTAIRYRQNPMQPAEVPLREMVVYSGDQVRIDEQGLLYFVGRKDEMIKTSGIRISPTEVEELLYATGMVETAMALGVPDTVLGHVIHVVIVPAPGHGKDAAKLIDACKAKMPPYMVPKSVEFHDSLPKNTNGKLDRALIKQQVYAALPKAK